MKRIMVYDTTLRDGAQGEGISFSVADKLEVVRMLDDLGVDYIEGGWPGSNAKDLEFFYALRSMPLLHSRVVAFTSTRRKGQRIEEDNHMQMVLGTGLRHCAVVGKTWDFHVEEALRTTLEENLSMIADTIAFLKDHEIEALFDAEHFFDGYKHNKQYALQALAAARDAGADWLVLCDTNGGTLPEDVERIVSEVKAAGFGPLAIHAHNDGALAVANSLAAVRAGAEQVQGTINGFGERCGNTDLCAVIPNLMLKMGYATAMQEDGLARLKSASQRLYEMTGKQPVDGQPFVGRSAFAHKAGIHVSAVVRNPKLYEHVAPQVVGNERRVLVSELSGASNVLYRLQELNLTGTSDDVTRILARVKEAEQQGYVYESAETSLELLMREELRLLPAVFRAARATMEGIGEGHVCTLTWQVEDVQHSRQGVGATPLEAMMDAMGFSRHGIRLRDERSVSLPNGRARVHVEGDWKGSILRTIGVADTILAARVEALGQLVVHAHLHGEEQEEKQRNVARFQ